MWDKYGKAVVQERVTPRNLAALAEYARMEYGPGTGLGYLLANYANGVSKGGRDRATLRGVLRTVANAVRSLVPANGHARKKATRTRVSE